MLHLREQDVPTTAEGGLRLETLRKVGAGGGEG